MNSIIPFMKNEPRHYRISYEVYFMLRNYSEKVLIPISTIARSIIEQFKAKNVEIKPSDISSMYDSLERKDEYVVLSVRLPPKVIDWLNATAYNLQLDSVSKLITYIIYYGMKNGLEVHCQQPSQQPND